MPAPSDTTEPSVGAVTPIVTTDTMQASLAFYRDVLGFSPVMTVPDDAPYDWVMLRQEDGATIQLQSAASVAEEFPAIAQGGGEGPVMLYLQVADVEQLRTRIEGHAEIVKDLHETFYGTREFAAKDPNGVVLVFATDV